ncbi:hypothetical protein ACFTTN_16435 [Streptomyces niveus]|uniref:hypothetical protein n=1 Tax=Streptomyces niveus TaxID=193462 RepID=UPI003632EDA0
MSGHSRKEDEVRRMLDVPHPPVPADLTARATALGTRVLNRRRTWRLLFWLLVTLAAVAFTVWASVVEPWSVPPSEKTPPLEGW